jgi:hypothetical protein
MCIYVLIINNNKSIVSFSIHSSKIQPPRTVYEWCTDLRSLLSSSLSSLPHYSIQNSSTSSFSIVYYPFSGICLKNTINRILPNLYSNIIEPQAIKRTCECFLINAKTLVKYVTYFLSILMTKQ